MRVNLAIVGLFLLGSSISAVAEVPAEIVALCKEQWGNDYAMRLYCQKKQMKAYIELNDTPSSRLSEMPAHDATIDRAVRNVVAEFRTKGMTGVRIAATECSKVADRKKTLETAKYCFALDIAAYILDSSFYESQGLSVDTEVEKQPSKAVDRLFKRVSTLEPSANLSGKDIEIWVTQTSASFRIAVK